MKIACDYELVPECLKTFDKKLSFSKVIHRCPPCEVAHKKWRDSINTQTQSRGSAGYINGVSH